VMELHTYHLHIAFALQHMQAIHKEYQRDLQDNKSAEGPNNSPNKIHQSNVPYLCHSHVQECKRLGM
jgi:hypothetical protein